MPTLHSRLLVALFIFMSLVLGSCQRDDDKETWEPFPFDVLRTGTWRLDQIRQNGQTISSGANIKDRYSLTFHRDGTYSQKLLADNTTFTGASWMLMSNDTMLHLTDHKGTESQYKVESLTSSELRYSFTNKDSQLEERVFSAQP